MAKDFGSVVLQSVDEAIEKLAAGNVFFVAKRKNANKDVLYLSAKVPRSSVFLVELTAMVGVPGVKCAVKTTNPELSLLFFEAIEALLK